MNQIQVITTEKFQDNQLVLRFSTPLDARFAIQRTILAQMLVDRCQAYPSKQAMNYALDELYGTDLSAQVFNIGYLHVLEISLRFLKQALIGVNLLNSAVSFLKQLLYQPLLTPALFNEAKDKVLDALDRIKDNPNQYNVLESLKVAGQGYPLGISNYGEATMIQSITLAEIQAAYHTLITQDRLDCFWLGEKRSDILELLATNFNFFEVAISRSFYNFSPKLTQEINLQRPIQQTYLTLVYNTTISRLEPAYWALQVVNTVFGQASISLLFQEVREKHSLCYSIGSQLLGNDGVLIVHTGIRFDAKAQVLKLIAENLDRLKRGGISFELLSTAKRLLIDRLLRSEDYSSAVINRAYFQLLTQQPESLAQILAEIEAVDLKSLAQAATSLTLNTVVTLAKE